MGIEYIAERLGSNNRRNIVEVPSPSPNSVPRMAPIMNPGISLVRVESKWPVSTPWEAKLIALSRMRLGGGKNIPFINPVATNISHAKTNRNGTIKPNTSDLKI